MTLPFMKRKEGSASAPAEPIMREHDEEFDMLDAIAEDLIMAVERKDKRMLKEALEALVMHIQEEDEEQDIEDTKQMKTGA